MKKVIVITGASSGIGRSTATLMAKQGHIVYDLSRSAHPQEGVRHIACDVTDPATIQNAFTQIATECGRIDILILSAGMGVAGAIEYTTETEMHRQFDVNVYGPIRTIQAALPIMRQQLPAREGKERARIVFVSSMAAQFGIPFQSMYSASKAAVNSLAFTLSNEVRDYRISVTCIMPGDVQTNFKRSTDLSGSDVYPKMDGAIRQMIRDEENGLSSAAVARRVRHAALTRRPRLFYTSDYLSDLEHLIGKLVPSSVAKRVVGWIYHC